MDKKLFDSLDESLKEKLRNCRNETELNKVICESGLQELSIEMLEGISGGQIIQSICPQAVDLGGMKCTSYQFV